MEVRVLWCPDCDAPNCRAHPVAAGERARCERCGAVTPASENVAGYVWCSGCLDKWLRMMGGSR